jgi:hypothetical protein
MWSPLHGADCRSIAIGLAIAGNPENDGPLLPWQEALSQDVVFD